MARVYVHLSSWLNVADYRSQYAKGIEPDQTPYGFHHAEKFGHSVEFPTIGPENRLLRWVSRTLNFDLAHGFRNIRKMRQADVIWTMLESDWMAVSFLQRCRLVPRVPVIGNSVWLFNNWSHMPRPKKWLYRFLLADNIYLTVHSKSYLPEVARLMPDLRISLMPFGISTDTFDMQLPRVDDTAGRRIRIMAAGSDPTRDWQTLFEAFGNDDRFEVTIICWRLNDDIADVYDNVKLPRNYSMKMLKDLYTWADFVIVPMSPNLYLGITVVLEAVAMGRPVISSDTGGSRTYFDDNEITYVPPCEPTALRDAVLNSSKGDRLAKAERARERFTRADYSTVGLMGRYAAITKRLLAPNGD